MSEFVNVTTQAELDKAVKDGNIPICREGFFRAYGSAQVRAYGSAQVEAYGSAQVRASGSAQVEASGSAQVEASGSAQVRAYGSAQVEASGSAQVRAYDSAQVEASGSAQVRAYDSAQVRAYDSAQVEASDSAQVEAYDSAQVEASGSAQVRASKFVAVTRQGDTVKVNGGVLIDIPPIKTAQDFCDFYGLKPSRGSVIVYKLVDDNFVSGHGTSYKPGEKPVASDWDGGQNRCGAGLHFSPRAFMARTYSDGTRFVACRVRLVDMVPITSYGECDKCKAKGCTVLFECDEDGREMVVERAAA